MEVGQESAHQHEFVSRIDEEVCLTRAWLDFTVFFLRRKFERAHGRGSDGYYSSLFGASFIDLLCGLFGNRIRLRMQLVLFDLLHSDGLEGSQAYMQRHLGGLNTPLA